MLSIWRDQKGIVYYELLQPGTTINAKHYTEHFVPKLRYELQDKRPFYVKRNDKVIFIYRYKTLA